VKKIKRTLIAVGKGSVPSWLCKKYWVFICWRLV